MSFLRVIFSLMHVIYVRSFLKKHFQDKMTAIVFAKLKALILSLVGYLYE